MIIFLSTQEIKCKSVYVYHMMILNLVLRMRAIPHLHNNIFLYSIHFQKFRNLGMAAHNNAINEPIIAQLSHNALPLAVSRLPLIVRSARDDLLPALLVARTQYSSASSPNTSLTTRIYLSPSLESSYLSLSKISRVPLYLVTGEKVLKLGHLSY